MNAKIIACHHVVFCSSITLDVVCTKLNKKENMKNRNFVWVAAVASWIVVQPGLAMAAQANAALPTVPAALKQTAAGSSKEAQVDAPAKQYESFSEILARSSSADWRTPDAEQTVYLELASGRVVLELAPQFSPHHVENIRSLIREGYFDGLAIIRSQDNYVVQWGDTDEKNPRPLKNAKAKMQPEFTRILTAAEYSKFAFNRLPDRDGYAPEVGFSNGFHAGRDPKKSTVWQAHCYGALGVGRGNELDSGSGKSLYVVTGHAPRHLDKNITLVGRVLQGMSLLSSLPRGTKALGFYDKPAEMVPIKSVKLAADVPPSERTNLQVIRTDTALFGSAVEALRNRGGSWFKVPSGHVELCNVPIAVRVVPPAPSVSAPAK